MTNAEQIFNKLNDRQSLVELLVSTGKEDLYVDFMRVPNAHAGIFCDSCKKNLGKGLSGFANSAGGLLVFGIKEEDGKFCLDPITAVRGFDQRIQENISRLTSYNVPNVLSKIIYENETDKNGYVLVLIPRSDLAPHQLVEDRKYYRRSGESFKPMEHFELENMFGRAPVPVLVPDIEIFEDGSTNDRQDYKIVVGVRNIGRLAGTFPYLGIRLKNGYEICEYELDGNRNAGLPKITSVNRGGINYREYGRDGSYIVFPDQFLGVTSSKLNKNKATNSFNRGNFEADFKLASKESKLSSVTVEISHVEIDEMIRNKKTYFQLKNS